MIDLSQHPDVEAVQRLKLAEIESKRKQGEYLLQYISDTALKREYKRRGLCQRRHRNSNRTIE